MINKKELININNTLSVLNRVIISLSTKNKIAKNINRTKTNDKFKNDIENSYNVHIPYRDSKLTRLLKVTQEKYTYINNKKIIKM